LKLTPEDCKELIYKLAKKGHTPSQIGNFDIHLFLLIKALLAVNLKKSIYLKANSMQGILEFLI